MHCLRRVALTLGKGNKLVIGAVEVSSWRCKHTNIMNDQAVVKCSIPVGIMGQPTCHTHPHLIEANQLTCGITQAEYRDRRDILMKKLLVEGENFNMNHIVIIPGAVKQYMSEKIPYVFRQNSNFYYLTGCLEPGAALVLLKHASIDKYRSVLFVHDKDSYEEMWEGPRTGCVAAAKMFAVDEARPIETLSNHLKSAVAQAQCMLWFNQTMASPDVVKTINSLVKEPNVRWADPERVLNFMRVIKSPAEVELMKQTCRIGAHSVNTVMTYTKPGETEHMLNAVLEFACKQGGAEHLAFPPVVAGGARATHIHYVNNDQRLEDNDLVLVDTGSQTWLYNSDISRTWPVNGRFTNYQRILYEIVLSTQKRLIQLLGEQRPPLDVLFDQMCRILGKHLQEEGIISRNLTHSQMIQEAYRLCPHHVSHYLGLDVHDTPMVKRNIAVQNNMVVTVEPGLYIRLDDKSVPAEFRGVGIRIEDDVLVTEGEPAVLTKDAVKEVNEVEAMVGQQKVTL